MSDWWHQNYLNVKFAQIKALVELSFDFEFLINRMRELKPFVVVQPEC